MNLELPRKGRLQQGTVFSCCAVAGYPGCEGWGVVITARCDLVVVKVPVLNYLPVVKLEDWLKQDGVHVIRARCQAESKAEVVKLLKDLGAPETVLLGTEPVAAIKALIGGIETKQQKSMRLRAEKVLEKYAIAHHDGGALEELEGSFPKLYSGVIRELMTHRLSGYYYLCRVDPSEDEACYVVLLRQIGTMPMTLAADIPAGLGRHAARARYEGFEEFLALASMEDLALPLGVIPSPYVEHLLQAFALLFGRIGLPDADPKHIDRYATPRSE